MNEENASNPTYVGESSVDIFYVIRDRASNPTYVGESERGLRGPGALRAASNPTYVGESGKAYLRYNLRFIKTLLNQKDHTTSISKR